MSLTLWFLPCCIVCTHGRRGGGVLVKPPERIIVPAVGDTGWRDRQNHPQRHHPDRAHRPLFRDSCHLLSHRGAHLTGRSGADSRSGESSLFSLASCPNGAPHTSLGQRPRKSAPHASCPEGAPHNLCENGLNAGPMLSPFRARSMVSPYPGRLPQSGICPGLVCRRAFSAQHPDYHLRRTCGCAAGVTRSAPPDCWRSHHWSALAAPPPAVRHILQSAD